MTTTSLLLYAGPLMLGLGACDYTEAPRQTALPKPTGLEGRWRYDSTGVDAYEEDWQHIGGSTEAMRPGAVLTIGTTEWVYSGSLHETHSYTRTKNTLLVRRIGDEWLVKHGYILAEGVGHVLFTSAAAESG